MDTKINNKIYSKYDFINMFPDRFFLKILNNDMTHYDFKYNIGLNIDTKNFNPFGKCKKGGLYFTDNLNFTYWIFLGNKIGLIEFPNDSKIYCEQCGTKYITNKFIITKIITKDDMFKLNLVKHVNHKNTFIIYNFFGYLEGLKLLFRKYNSKCKWDKNACNIAAKTGHLECLIFLYENNCPHDDQFICFYSFINDNLDCLKYINIKMGNY